MEQVTWYVGIDWGSESHAVCVVDAAGHRREERRVDHTADAVQACLDWIMTFTGATPAQIAVVDRPLTKRWRERPCRVRGTQGARLPGSLCTI